MEIFGASSLLLTNFVSISELTLPYESGPDDQFETLP